VGRSHDISIGLLVVGDRLYAKYLAQLVHQLPLLAVHRGEGVAPRALLALLGQLHQISQRLVNALGQRRVSLCEATYEFRVLGQGFLLCIGIS